MATKPRNVEPISGEAPAPNGVAELSIWTNTPEEERREIEEFMEAMFIDMWNSLPPYDWGEEEPVIKVENNEG